MLLITVNVINAPNTPPSKVYLGSTIITSLNEVLSVINHAPRHTMSAVNCTKTFAAQRLEFSVTLVLNTPCMLISAPEIIAIIKPTISVSPLITAFIDMIGYFDKNYSEIIYGY
jgi:hypothetical protein